MRRLRPRLLTTKRFELCDILTLESVRSYVCCNLPVARDGELTMLGTTDNYELCFSSIEKLQYLYKSKSITPSKLVEHYIKRSQHLENYNFFYSFHSEGLLGEAVELDDQPMKPSSTLYGTFVVLKDHIMRFAGYPNSEGSYANQLWPNQNITFVTTKFISDALQAGSTVLGRGTCLEKGMFADSSNSTRYLAKPQVEDPDNLHDLFIDSRSNRIVRNPHDLTKSVGGNSGGTAAAVAVGLGNYGFGNDCTGGIRIPASWCGVYGLKIDPRLRPDWGDTFHSSGIFSRSTRDMALVLDTISPGKYSILDTIRTRGTPNNDLKIAYCPDFGGRVDVDTRVSTVVDGAVNHLGYPVEKVDLPIDLDSFRDAFIYFWQCTLTRSYRTSHLKDKLHLVDPNVIKYWLLDKIDTNKENESLHILDKVKLEVTEFFEKYDHPAYTYYCMSSLRSWTNHYSGRFGQ
eukprot:TRINITY_DN10794_c0_g2_i1.p1 TRINITY_DN10794_c0_g2~~TRINITY_DN10794_c0_g2_i1.p1  ORF type:complete len:459 (+),score=32.88 TRINITY_DN10794_c0_g2_i1:82-1458(+)